MTKHMFAGASTPEGFIDLFDYIMPLKIAKKRYFLKGSSGSGKSTFIKKVAAHFENMGVEIEKFHCANDIDSLDALAVPSLGLCIIDATVPHSHDPEIPIAIDKIIDFSEFMDEQKITKHINEIKSLLLVKKAVNKKAAHYLAAVGNIYLAENKDYLAAFKKDSLNELTKKWIKFLESHKGANDFGSNRKLFLSAITPDGFTNFAGSYFSNCKVYGLLGGNYSVIDGFLTTIRDEANAQGINTESFYSPFAPEIMEYLYLPKMKIAFAAVGSPFVYNGEVEEIIFESDIGKDKDYELFDTMLNKAIDTMMASRKTHEKIENIYINAMDFDNLNKMSEKIINGIL
ncbi:MAG: hypothetical protein FWE24_04910 [Defluviitaleaceae bacterium]|nr:hypothetical protein [Defluviitaleaceae bacterium]